MNQFSSLYGQLFCCNCPTGVPETECAKNNSSLLLAYPFLGQDNYVWVAGVVGFIVFILVLTFAVIFYLKRKKRLHDDEMISIIRIRRALLGSRQTDECQDQALIANMCENASNIMPEDGLNGTRIAFTDDEDSFDQADTDHPIDIDGAMLNIKMDYDKMSLSSS